MKRKPIRLLPEKAAGKLRKFWDFLYGLFRSHDNPERAPDPEADPPPDDGAFLCCEPKHEAVESDWAERNVMVGSLRTAEQFRYTLEQRRYYAPDRFLPTGTDWVKLIALHEEGIGTEPGIRLWGEVLSVRSLARKQIPVAMRPGSDPGELYREYTVQEWKPLPHPIRLLDTYRGRPRFTTEFLLKHCTRSYQLFVLSSQADLELMNLTDRIFAEIRNEAAATPDAEYPFGDVRFRVSEGQLTATDGDGFLRDTVPLDWLARHPRAGFCRIKRMLARQTEDRAEPE